MKRTIAFLVVLAFVAGIASVVFARTLDEERDAVRAYLKVVDGKIIKYRKAKNTAKMKVLQAEKKATLARWEKLKAQMGVAPAPGTQPMAPLPPTAPGYVAPAAAPAGMFGMGVNTNLAGQYISTGKGSASGSIGVMGNMLLDDFIGLGPMVGMPANSVKFTVGMGGFYGGGGLKAIPLKAGGIINLPADWMGGLESYVTGGLNYVVYGNGTTSGKIGGDVYYGINADLGLGLGKTGFELGYNVVRSNTVSSKGISLSVSQPLAL
jgi:hypothetical protein